MVLQEKPGPYVAEIKDSTQFYGNRVLKEFKEKYARSDIAGGGCDLRVAVGIPSMPNG